MTAESREDRRPILAIRSDSADFDLFDTKDSLHIYADGISNVNMGLSVSRIDFFRTSSVRSSDGSNPKGPKIHEDRDIVAQVSIPTLALIEAFVGTIGNFLSQQEEFFANFNMQKEGMTNALKALQSFKSENV